jgi:alpha-galactosidase/6-phospho-beta-glucosidase family protein
MEKKDTYEIPAGAKGVTMSIVEHQNLVTEAIAENDKRKFVQGIYAYPMCRDRNKVEIFLNKMFEARKEELPDFLKA